MEPCNDDLPYFAGKPAGFSRSADVLLVLDSGEELPVHCAFLASHSHVLCEMISIERLPFGVSAAAS